MRTIGLIATAVVAVSAIAVLVLTAMSVPDIRRYLAMRRM